MLNTAKISLEEQELIQKCLLNDQISQKKLYELHSKEMFTLALRVINNYDDACDILQEAYIGVFKGLKNFRGDSTLKSWIKSIVIKKSIDKLKKQTLFVSLEESKINESIEWENNFTIEELEKAIHSLPNGYRIVFVLIEIEGYTHKEVAEMHGISVGTSKSQLFHAKKRLQEKLKQFKA